MCLNATLAITQLIAFSHTGMHSAGLKKRLPDVKDVTTAQSCTPE